MIIYDNQSYTMITGKKSSWNKTKTKEKVSFASCAGLDLAALLLEMALEFRNIFTYYMYI